MPLYEFKCIKCNEMIELLIMNKEEEIDLCCPKCGSREIERVISSTSYVMGNSSNDPQASSTTRNCSTGSCTTYDIPGPS